MSNEVVQDLLEFLGPDAQRVFESPGEDAEYIHEPDSIEFAEPHLSLDSHKNEAWWRKDWYVVGWRVVPGTVYAVIHSCDSDGNWDVEDECDVTAPRYPEWLVGWMYTNPRPYYQHVADTGEDPLDVFFTAPPRPVSFRFHLIRNSPCWEVYRVWFEGTQYSEFDILPDRIRTYLQLDAKLDFGPTPTLVHFEDYTFTEQSLDEIKATVEVDLPPSPETQKQYLITKAQKALAP